MTKNWESSNWSATTLISLWGNIVENLLLLERKQVLRSRELKGQEFYRTLNEWQSYSCYCISREDVSIPLLF